MITATPQRRRTPAALWQAAKVVYLTDRSMSLPVVAERFGLPFAALRKRCSRGKWLRREDERATSAHNVSTMVEPDVPLVPIKSAGDFRQALQEEAKAWLILLRNARQRAGNDAVEVAKSIAPLLGTLGRLAEKAFAEPTAQSQKPKMLLHPDVFLVKSCPGVVQMEDPAAADVQPQ